MLKTKSGWVHWTLYWVTLSIVLIYLATSTIAGTVNPKKIVCKNRDMKPAIQVEQCKPSFSTKRAACEKLIRKCKCQHDIEMKWTGAGCPGSKGEGGCQCAEYCGWSCPGKCRADPLKKCRYLNGECSNINNGGTGPMIQCPVPTSAPSASPTTFCFPGESIVITTTGPKRMDQLEIGEYVQDVALYDEGDVKAGTVRFTQFIAWLHLGRETMADYLEIFVDNPLLQENANQTVLRISGVHVLFIQDQLTKEYRSVTAQQVRVGDYVYLASDKKKQGVNDTPSKAVVGKVTMIRDQVVKKGFYGPMTLTGSMVVDGVHISSYIVAYHDLVNIFCAPLRWYAQYIGRVPEWYTPDGYHYYSKFVMWLSTIIPAHLYTIPAAS